MQIDMHYGAVLFLALLARIPPEEAQTIAWSSQHVDDARFGGAVQFRNGDGLLFTNSAHRFLTDNISPLSRRVWVPFHFIPGCAGATFLDRLACAADGVIARNAVRAAGSEPYRFGVALHAYADTWSHHGFSGVWSELNVVDDVTPTNVTPSLWERFKAGVGDRVAHVHRGLLSEPVGHLMADVCPDLPYLEWNCVPASQGQPAHRSNPGEFLRALEAMHAFCQAYAEPHRWALSASEPLPPDARKAVTAVLDEQEDNAHKRLTLWFDLIHEWFPGTLARLPGHGAYDEEAWFVRAFGEPGDEMTLMVDRTASECAHEPIVQFTRALRAHGDFVAREMERYGLPL